MASHRFKHSFVAGELSPLMEGRVDFDRYKNGCKRLYNMYCAPQGPAIRRPGLRFVTDLTALVNLPNDPILRVRKIPWIGSADGAYVLVFVETEAGVKRVYIFHKLQWYTNSTGSDYLTLPVAWDIENFDYTQSIDTMWFVMRDLAPQTISLVGDVFTLDGAFTFNPPPKFPMDAGATGADYWSDTNGWPERVAFHQQRLVFGANLAYRDHIWMSASGQYDNLGYFDDGVSTPSASNGANAVIFSLASGTYNAITWITSGKTLNIGTTGDEWTVTGVEQIAITSQSVLALRQTSVGSEALKPVLVGNTTLFLSRGGRETTEFIYAYNEDSFKTSDLAILSPHMTDLYPIIDWTYQQQPSSIIWAVRSDGALLGLTYQRQHKVIGWHGHATTGKFKAVAAIPGETRETDVYTTVARTLYDSEGLNPETKWYVEVLEDQFIEGHAKFGKFVDSHVQYEIAIDPANVVEDNTLCAEYIAESQACVHSANVQDFCDTPIASSLSDQQKDDCWQWYVGTPTRPVTPTGYPVPVPVNAVVEHTYNPGQEDEYSTIYVELTGLDHLENKYVDIVIDGAVYPRDQVINGQVKVYIPDKQVSDTLKAVVGLNYLSEVRPYIHDAVRQDGTTLGRTQRITKLDIDFYNTLGAVVGKVDSETNVITEEEIPFRQPTDIMGQGLELYTGVYHWDFPEGFSRKTDYFIKQKQPLPLTVRGVTDTSEVFE